MTKTSPRTIGINRRKARIRTRVKGTAQKPRLSVFMSNQHLRAQLIDDDKGVTLAQVSTVNAKVEGSMTDKAAWVGEAIAKAGKSAKVTKVVFDRGGRLYNQRLKALAEAARKGGLEF